MSENKVNYMNHLPFCKTIFKEIHCMWGSGWKLLGDDLKRAVIAERVLYALIGRDPDSSITPNKIHEYVRAVNFYYGLELDSDPEE